MTAFLPSQTCEGCGSTNWIAACVRTTGCGASAGLASSRSRARGTGTCRRAPALCSRESRTAASDAAKEVRDADSVFPGVFSPLSVLTPGSVLARTEIPLPA